MMMHVPDAGTTRRESPPPLDQNLTSASSCPFSPPRPSITACSLSSLN